MQKIQHHIRLSADDLAGNGQLGRYVLLPGDPSRAAKIAEHFENVEMRRNPRGLHGYSGSITRADGRPIDVLTLPSGMGSASTEVVVNELITCGARRLLRVGSCGSMVSTLPPGSAVIVTGAVRDETTSRHYARTEVPALAHPRPLAALAEAARRADLAAVTFRGVCHSKASLYAREFSLGPLGREHALYTEELRRCGVIATEMEASTLFILAASVASEPRPLAAVPGFDECQAAAVLAVFAHDDSQMELDQKLMDLAEERTIRLALEGIRVWSESDQP